jgi:hypothetical protein
MIKKLITNWILLVSHVFTIFSVRSRTTIIVHASPPDSHTVAHLAISHFAALWCTLCYLVILTEV